MLSLAKTLKLKLNDKTNFYTSQQLYQLKSTSSVYP